MRKDVFFIKKDYMDYDSINDDLSYTDKDYEYKEKTKIIEPIEKENNKISKDKSNNDIIIDENKNLINTISSFDRNNFKKTNKEFCEKFNYINETKQFKPKINFLKYLKNIIKFIFNILYYLLKIILMLLLIILISNAIKSFHINKLNVKENNKIETSIAETIKEHKEIPTKETNEFINITIKYIEELQIIINGENSCINNLRNNIIGEKDAYNYFYKTLNNKDNLLSNYLKEEYNEKDLIIRTKTKKIFLDSINISKSIMTRHINSENYSKMVNDMDLFNPKFEENITELENLLNEN